MRVQKAIALNVLDQLGDENEVGVVAFNFQPYRVASPQPLSQNREVVADQDVGGAGEFGCDAHGWSLSRPTRGR